MTTSEPRGAVPGVGRQACWVIAGTLGTGAAQWLMLALMAQRVGAATVGSYALALAVTAPCFTLTMLQLRAMLVVASPADAEQRPFVQTRLLTTAAAVTGLAVVSTVAPGAAGAFLLPLALCRGLESVGDIHLARLQREGCSHRMGQCQALAATGSILVFAAVLWVSDDAILAMWALVPVSLVLGCLLPWRAARTGPDLAGSWRRAGWPEVRSLVRDGLPLGLSSTVGSLVVSAPRWSLNASAGPASVGAYAGAAQLVQIASTVVGAATQPWFPAEAKRYRDQGYPTIRRTRLLAVATILLVGVVLVPVAALIGPDLLTVLYGDDFRVGAAGCALFAIAGSTVLGNWFLEYALVIVDRRQYVFAVNLGALVVVVAAASALVPAFDVAGAAAASAFGAGFQVAAKAVGLRRRAVEQSRPGRHRADR